MAMIMEPASETGQAPEPALVLAAFAFDLTLSSSNAKP
jgi:hypothetical protein